METRLIEATNTQAGGFNWGKFLVGRFDREWEHRSAIGDRPLLRSLGWAPFHLLVLDLGTGEGCLLRPGGVASADLAKHQVWVCPLFEPFLEWLYCQDLSDLSDLPALVELPSPESSFRGYRRPGA